MYVRAFHRELAECACACALALMTLCMSVCGREKKATACARALARRSKHIAPAEGSKMKKGVGEPGHGVNPSKERHHQH